MGFPNVRRANSQTESTAFEKRYKETKASAAARGIAAEFEAFETAVAQSKAVLNRSLGVLSSWLNGSSPLFLSFQKQVDELGREPAETEWDRQRTAAESAINPHCYKDLNYAALSLGRVDKKDSQII